MPIYKTSLKERLLSNIIKDDNNCWNWQGYKTKFGHGQIRFNNVTMYVHRASYETFVGKIDEGNVICHRCDNPSCINPNHLFMDNQFGNVKDMVWKNRSPIMDNIVSDNEIIEIRKLWNTGKYKISEISKKFDRDYGWTWRVVNNKKRQFVDCSINDNCLLGGT